MGLKSQPAGPGSSCGPFQDLEEGMKWQYLHALNIGGGIAGPALALLLKKAGMSSAVSEAHPRLEDVGGGFTIAANGMRVLEEIGIAGLVADSGAKMSEFCFRNQRGQGPGALSGRECGKISLAFESDFTNSAPPNANGGGRQARHPG
jgi:FAD binding domain